MTELYDAFKDRASDMPSFRASVWALLERVGELAAGARLEADDALFKLADTVRDADQYDDTRFDLQRETMLQAGLAEAISKLHSVFAFLTYPPAPEYAKTRIEALKVLNEHLTNSLDAATAQVMHAKANDRSQAD